ncbi:MAG: hypothetical protein GTO63_26830, partial [Anaerolineae bacterium]|nr:hypothetical protein [Anaerolineae bacterium]NIN98340.1 hypothetical protein [Anaerolineae bacterium]NIQ81263.1 hypothetical protein [Anaerolineae bacterium]
VVAAEFVLVDGFFDPSYALGIWTSDPTIVALVSVMPAIFFLVVAPLLVFPSRSTRGRIGGLLLPLFIALVGGEIISGAVRPYYLESWTWLMRAIGSVQFLMVVALAAVMCHRIGRRGRLTNIRGGAAP